MLNKGADMKVAVAVTRYMGVSDGEQLSQDEEVILIMYKWYLENNK